MTVIVNRGAFVRALTLDEAMDIYELNAVIFGLAAGQLAVSITAAQALELQALVDGMDRAGAASDPDAFFDLNVRFHQDIMRLARNRQAEAVYGDFTKKLLLFRRRSFDREGTCSSRTASTAPLCRRSPRATAARAGARRAPRPCRPRPLSRRHRARRGAAKRRSRGPGRATRPVPPPRARMNSKSQGETTHGIALRPDRHDLGRRLKLEDGIEWAARNQVHHIDIQLDTGVNAFTSFDETRARKVKEACERHDIQLGLHTLSAVTSPSTRRSCPRRSTRI